MATMRERLALRFFKSHPETRRWNLRVEDWPLLDSLEIKQNCYRQADEIIDELRVATEAMYEAGDAVAKVGHGMIAAVWDQMIMAANREDTLVNEREDDGTERRDSGSLDEGDDIGGGEADAKAGGGGAGAGGSDDNPDDASDGGSL